MKIRELFTDESKWTKHANARDVDRFSVSPKSDAAVCWCLNGAIVKCYSKDTTHLEVRMRIRKEMGSVAPWNDDINTTFQDVKALVERLDI